MSHGFIRNWFACYSFKIFFLLLPLITFYGFLSSLGPKTSTSTSALIHSFPSPSSSGYSRNNNTNLIHEDVRSVVHNFSSSIPLDATDQGQQPKRRKEENGYKNSSTISINESPKFGLLNETSTSSHVVPAKRELRKRVLTSLDKVEAGLQRARAAIKLASNETQIDDPDLVPYGPMYWDPKAFHRSYLEMEKVFKIFIYEDGDPPVFHDGPCKSIYSMEGNFINKMEAETKFRTKDPDKAHVFYLPFSVAKMVHFIYVRDSRDFSTIRNTVVDYVNLVAAKYPYWNRSLGHDHLMLSCHDWGPHASFSLPYLEKNAIRAFCNANTSEKFNPRKDVSIPEINLKTEKLTGLIGGPSASRRPILAFFAGGVHGPIRPVVLEHWENKDEDIKVHKYLPKGVSYTDMMRKSKYCICPSGYEVASPRIVEALYAGCVPVLINVDYAPPFSDILNWKSFSVKVSVSDVPNLKKILMGISSRQYIRMYRRVLKVRRHFEFNSPPKRFDVYHMILHSVWLRRLNVRIHENR